MNNLIAHRGLKINAQENTLKAFQNALNNPHYAGFECDIRTSKDGVFVICHNPLIKEDIISLTNYKDLSKYRDYLDKIKKRSMIDFDNSVSTQNKILTLSTCYNNWEKMVVHAKLVKQEKRY